MRAIAINSFGGPERLKLMNLPTPTIAPDEVLIQVRAAGVGPWDCFIRRGDWGLPGQLPFVLGGECAGVIERVGKNVARFKEGDAVFCYARQGGNYAEYFAASAIRVTAKPTSIDFDHAAATPISGLTAHQALDELGLRAGETILITAAAGGTGTFAVQIAADLGAHVIGTASARNHAYLRKLGAAEVIDYTRTDFAQAVRTTHPNGVDAVLDNVGGDTLVRCLDALRNRGRLSYAASPSLSTRIATPRGITAQPVYGRPDADRLAVLARMVDDGRLAVPLDGVLLLTEAAQAHERVEAGHVRGKLVLSIDGSPPK